MSVVSLHGADLINERRASFLNSVAAAFDKYVVEHGYEPDALVYVMAGITQNSLIGWDVNGASERGVGSVLSLAAVHALTEAGRSRQGLDATGESE